MIDPSNGLVGIVTEANFLSIKIVSLDSEIIWEFIDRAFNEVITKMSTGFVNLTHPAYDFYE